jgi:N-acylneuraminate cytidylyltransferase
VSTDSEEIAELARKNGAEVPFLRPAKISQDDSPDLPVFLHFLDWLKERAKLPELIVHLRPTSPIRRKEDIELAIKMMSTDSHADSLRAVIEPSQNPFKMWRENEGYLTPFFSETKNPFVEENYNKPRQVLPRVLWQTGYLDVIRTETLLEKKSMTGRKILPFEIQPEYAFDLDTPFDWEWAEAFWRVRLSESK